MAYSPADERWRRGASVDDASVRHAERAKAAIADYGSNSWRPPGPRRLRGHAPGLEAGEDPVEGAAQLTLILGQIAEGAAQSLGVHRRDFGKRDDELLALEADHHADLAVGWSLSDPVDRRHKNCGKRVE